MPVGVGVEIGETAVRAAVVESRGGDLRLTASAEIPYAGRDDVLSALSRLRAAVPIRRAVVLGLPTSSAIVATVHPLIVQPQRAGLAVAFELQQHLPCDVSQTAWHYAWWSGNGHQASPRPLAAENVPAVAAAVKRSILEARLSACRQAGFAVQTVTVTAVALINVWQTLAARTQRTQRAQRPAREAEPAQERDAFLLWWDRISAEWIRVGPGGVRIIPVALPRQDVPEAGAVSPSFVQALRRGWEEMARAGSPPPAASASIIRLAGEAATSPALAEAIRREWSQSAEPVDPSSILSLSPYAPANPERLLPAIGLALQGIETTSAPLNLIADRHAQRRVRRLARIAQLLTAVGAVAAIGFGFHAMWTVRERRQAVLDQLLSQARVAAQLRPEIRQQLKHQALVMDRTRQLEDLATRRVLVAQAVQRVTEALPSDMWLTTTHVTIQQDMLMGTVEGVSRSFQGVTKFLDALKSSVGWETVKPLTTAVTSQPSVGTDVVTFAVQVQQPLAKASPPAEALASSETSSRRPAAPRNSRAPRRATSRSQ